jgi:hypothetical protein
MNYPKKNNMTTLKNYLDEFASDIQEACFIDDESGLIVIEEDKVKELVDEYLKMIVERMVGVE